MNINGNGLLPEIEVDLNGFAYGGEAMGRLANGKAIFVPFALPGERVRIQIVEERKQFARGKLVEILVPASHRIQSRCIHFGECGGCSYQHLGYEDQLKAKKGILTDQLERIGGIAYPAVADPIPSTQAWNYRNSIQFHLDQKGKLCFLQAGSDRLVQITECHLPQKLILEALPGLDFEGVGDLERISIRMGAEEDLMIILEGSAHSLPALELDMPVSVVHLAPESSVVMAGDDHLFMQVLGRDFQLTAGSFFQVNTAATESMVQHLQENLNFTSKTTLLDVYCGGGLFSAFLAPRCHRVIGIESSATACEDYAINLDEFDNVILYQGAAGQILPGLKEKVDIVVVDPPRAGLEKTALDALLRIHAPQIAYVSCDPATLARDARRLLAAGYQIVLSTPIDMFPQTGNIESITLFHLGTV